MTRVFAAGLIGALLAGSALAQTPAKSSAKTPAPTPAAAPTQTPQPAADAPLGGPQIPGVCLLSQQAVFANALVGKAANDRLKQVTEQTQAELEPERSALQADAKALDAQRATLKPADLTQKQTALAARLKALQDKADLRGREIEATREKAQARILVELRPVVAQVYTARGCGLLFDRNGVLGGNMAGDLTAAVVQALDARISTITFDRETLPPAAKP